jgi:hypothetical protein
MDDHDGEIQRRGVQRRELLLGLGALGAGGLWQATRGARALAQLAPATASTAAACVLTPEVTEGPYWIANHLTRRNITDRKPGLARGRHRRLFRLQRQCSPVGRRRSRDTEQQQALPARPPEERLARSGPVRHDLPGLVPRANPPYPPQGSRPGQRCAHRAAVPSRQDQRRCLPLRCLQASRAA